MYLACLKREKKLLLIDKYAYTNKLSNSNPFIKFAIVAIALFITTITKNNFVNLIIFASMVFSTTILAGIPLIKYCKILFIPFTFLLLSVISILISISSVDVFLVSIPVKTYYIGIAETSISTSILLTTRVFASISATFFLGLTTPLNNLIKVFRKLHFPKLLIELIVLIYRSIFIFLQAAKDIYDIQEMKFGYNNFKNSLNSSGLLIRTLFTRILLTYEEMIITLECKLYDGDFRTGD